ncbi:MAG: hypothetical protein ACT4TC_03980 [Myxococcaceae bacterium]
MAREIGLDPRIWADPEFCALSVEERLAWISFIAEAEDTPFADGIRKIDRNLALTLFHRLKAKGLVSVPPGRDRSQQS